MNALITARPALADLRRLGPSALQRLLRAGHPIDPVALRDTMYRGVSLGIPHWVEKLAWTTFLKTFRHDPQTGALRGWNVKLEQTGLQGEVVPKRARHGGRVTFGHYEVVAPRTDRDGPGLLIDYGRGRNPRFDVTARLRDPIVSLSPGDPSALLGWTYVDLGLAVPTPSYFLLERLGTLDHDAAPPR